MKEDRQKICGSIAILIGILLAGLMSGCQALEKKQQAGAVVEVNGHYLYRSSLDSLTVGLSGEDSMRVAQQYISQWAKDILLYDEAKAHVTYETEQMVEEYRRTLYVQAFEEQLVARRMPKSVADTTVAQVYNQMSERFKLDESIVRGLLLIVPNDAPNIVKMKKELAAFSSQTSEESSEKLDLIEKYAYQNAIGYELFTDRWTTVTDLMARVPMDRTELEAKLKNKPQIEVSDTVKTYILQITDKRLRGEQMPVDFARPEIERIILNARQVDFLNKERERRYNEAIQEKKVNFL